MEQRDKAERVDQEEGADVEVHDHDATLEVGQGSPGIRVLFHVAEVTTPGGNSRVPDRVEVVGYLRLAFGQGNFANRLLNSLGKPARLVMASGAAHSILLSGGAPAEAPGYLCSFQLLAAQELRAA